MIAIKRVKPGEKPQCGPANSELKNKVFKLKNTDASKIEK